MDMMVFTISVILCVSLSCAITVPPGVEVKCPSRYHVKVFDNKVVEFEVSDNKTECDILAGRRRVKEVNREMSPVIEVVYKDGLYRANISWDYVLRGKRLPRLFLIDFTFYNIMDMSKSEYRYLNDACVLLRLVGRRKIKNTSGPTTARFYFDCLPLLNEPNIGLVVRLWSYTKKQGRPCRSLRSLPEGKGSCGTDVRCSKDYSFPISKNFHSLSRNDKPFDPSRDSGAIFNDNKNVDTHSYRQCACHVKDHGEPKLHWFYDYNEEIFHINFTNVPPYLVFAQIEIVEESNDSIIDTITVHNIELGEIYNKSRRHSFGKYSVYVCVKLDMECKSPGESESLYENEINDQCNYAEFYYFVYSNQKLTVSMKTPSDTNRTEDPGTILGVVGGVLLAVTLTTVVFFICKYRRKSTSSNSRHPSDHYETPHSHPLMNDSNNIEMRPFHREGQSPEEVDNESTHDQIDNEREETDFNETNNHTSRERRTVSAPNQERMCHSINYEHDDTGFTSQKHRVMLLYHPDANNRKHIWRVKQFSQTLSKNYGILLESKTKENWQDFAESAFLKFKHIVLVISEGLVSLCHHYIHSKQLPQNLLAERDHEIIPCIVLRNMHNLLSQDPKCRGVAIHIVAFDYQTNLLKQFLKDHPFLKEENSQYENTFFHKIYDRDLQSENLAEFVGKIKHDVEKEIFEKPVPIHLQEQLKGINLES